VASASDRVATWGNTTPSAPQSSTGLTRSVPTPATRTSGVAGVPPVAAIMAATDSMPIGACSVSIISQSTPVRASAWTSCTLGIETR
jgi:hypothetical protein